jgi:SAM-dependent methyltransferase
VVREQRLVFGEVADLYDRHRPSYPAALIDDLVALAGLDGSQAVLEVGAGTGKATVMFAKRGIPIVAVEPSAEMAAVARRNTSAYRGIEIEQSDFERWDPRGRRFPLLFCAQAWHWVDPAAGFAKARDSLFQHGVLAPFWNRFAWDRSELREALIDAYDRTAPQLRRESPQHPANLGLDDHDWDSAIAGTAGMTDPEVRFYHWTMEYSADEYIALLDTTSDIRLLDEKRRTALLTAVAAVIQAQGEPLTLPLDTRLCLARRA